MFLKKHYPLVLLSLLLLVQWGDYSLSWTWIHRFTLLGFLLILTIADRLSLVYGRFASVFLTYFLGVGLWAFRTPSWSELDPRLQQGLHLAAAGVLTWWLLSYFFVFHLFGTEARWYWRAMRWAALAVGLGSLYQGGDREGTLFLHNPSMTATFLALMVFRAPSLVWAACGVACVLWSGTSTPVAALLVPGVYLCAQLLRKKISKPWILVAPSALAAWGMYVVWPKLGGGRGRYAIWGEAWHFFRAQSWDHQVFGLGLGSTPIFVPWLQISRGEATNLFMYLHNDWFQVLFEAGWVGLTLSLVFYSDVLRRLSGGKRLVAMGFGVAMCTNYPWHMPLTALLGLLLVGEAYGCLPRDMREKGV